MLVACIVETIARVLVLRRSGKCGHTAVLRNQAQGVISIAFILVFIAGCALT
jgi:hypothetical protein